MGTDGIQDVDAVLTTRELARLIQLCGIDFDHLPEESFDNPLGLASGAADIFAASGGVMEAALRTAHYLVRGKSLNIISRQSEGRDSKLRVPIGG
jgi:iron only hydrogenase large subunit-like protein